MCKSCNFKFEGWFENSNSYKQQLKKNLIRCPNCESSEIEKGLMAPNVTKKSNSKEKKQKKSIASNILKLNYITIHLSSGLEAIKAAKKVSGMTKLVGVTILTSLDNKSLREIGFNKDLKKIVLDQAKLAQKAKLDALVCSPLEIKIVRKVFKKEIITPGIRLSGHRSDDQKRVMTPKQAFQNGATALVMGRSLIKGNLKKNIQKLIKELK